MKIKLSALFLLTAISSISVLPAQAQMTGGYDEYQECETAAQRVRDAHEDCMSGVWDAAWAGAAQGAATGAFTGSFITGAGALPGAAMGGFTGFLMGGDQAKRKCDNTYGYGFDIDCSNGGYSTTTPDFFPDYSRDTDGDGVHDQSYSY